MMKTFRNFIKEDANFSEVMKPYKTTRDLLQDVRADRVADLMLTMDQRTMIMRGMGFNSTEKMYVGDGNKLVRTSANTANYYTMLMSDYLPSWKYVPRRDKSFICSTSSSTASAYGSVYVVVPLEDQSIGICSAPDFWQSFPNVNKSLEDQYMSLNGFNRVLSSLYSFLMTKKGSVVDEYISHDDKNAFFSDLEKMFKVVKEGNHVYRSSDIEHLANYLKKYNTIKDAFDDLFNPEKNDIKVKPYSDFYDIDRKVEVWMSGKVLFIKYEHYDKIREELSNFPTV